LPFWCDTAESIQPTKGIIVKLRSLAFLCLFSLNSFAVVDIPEEAEVIMSDEFLEAPKVKISDVKKLIATIGADKTCMDEYLKRRKQLILKLALSPATIVAGTYAGTIVAGFVGVGVAGVLSFDPLGGVILGMFFGFVGTASGTLIDTNIAAFQLADIDRILKVIAEQYLNESGEKSEKLYSKYTKQSQSPVDEETFFRTLIELDESGKLCDGSLVKKPRFASGKKLKHKIARSKHLVDAI
jgi:hypothetical protein